MRGLLQSVLPGLAGLVQGEAPCVQGEFLQGEILLASLSPKFAACIVERLHWSGSAFGHRQVLRHRIMSCVAERPVIVLGDLNINPASLRAVNFEKAAPRCFMSILWHAMDT